MQELFFGEENGLIKKKEAIAKGIRVLSVPPVMVTAPFMALYALRPNLFRNSADVVVSLVLLGFVPILAYPLKKVLPAFKKKGREGERKLAFILNLAGYTAAFVWALIEDVGKELLLICTTYFGSVVLLTICNQIIHFRASGHACSFTGPIVLSVYLIGMKAVAPCLLAAIFVIWSTLILKRHTGKELLGGSAVCIVSFAASLILTSP